MSRAPRIGLVVVALLAVAGLVWLDLDSPYDLWLALVAGAAPLVLLAWFFLARAADERLALALAGLGTGGPDTTVRGVLRRVLADPDLEIVYTQVGSGGGWITGLGEQAARPVPAEGRAFTPIDRDGKPVAGLVHDRRLLRHPRRLQAALDAASLALDNERLKAQLRAELLEVRASRSRIIDASDRELQRVERNLHDGAQQRLVGLALMFRLASRRAAGDQELTALLDDGARELSDAIAELRELTRGIHPAIVDDAGLSGALESLAERPGLPVELEVDLPVTVPEVVEVAAYYLVAEALTNANKHANAAHVAVHALTRDGVLRLTVRDDGVGGAVASPRSGLQGLADRIGALGGTFTIDSPPGSGTTVTAGIPLAPSVLTDSEQQRMTALRWFVHENWEMPGEVVDQITDEDNLIAGKVMLLAAGGNARITEREREWVVGYLTAARDADWVIEAVTAYDDSDTLEDLMQLPGIPETVRGMLYDGIRMCASDGPLTPDELSHLERSAATLGIAREELDELCAIVAADAQLRRRRFNAVVVPVLPRGFSPST
ncbi:histidine kinase [Nocardioides sp. LHD-245]|uniref:ATP-binding protein n=1 Tax=Nocardioides sp. LHD-245 TaxID=3051387 RepID=UPI0027E02BE9|nr:histidine kinase [Nocardioides sp. LHD-245]